MTHKAQTEQTSEVHAFGLTPMSGFQDTSWKINQPVEIGFPLHGGGTRMERFLLRDRPDIFLRGETKVRRTGNDAEIEIQMPLIRDASGGGCVALWPVGPSRQAQRRMAERLNGALWHPAVRLPPPHHDWDGPPAPRCKGQVLMPAALLAEAHWSGNVAIFSLHWPFADLPELMVNPVFLERPSSGLEEDALDGRSDALGEMTFDLAGTQAGLDMVPLAISLRDPGSGKWAEVGPGPGPRRDQRFWMFDETTRRLAVSGLAADADFIVRLNWQRQSGERRPLPMRASARDAILIPLALPTPALDRHCAEAEFSRAGLRRALIDEHAVEGCLDAGLRAAEFRRTVVPVAGGGYEMQLRLVLDPPDEGDPASHDLARRGLERRLAVLLPFEARPRLVFGTSPRDG